MKHQILLILLLFPFALFSDTSFITDKEYSSELYKNPRGIGCHSCHGKKGEGKLIASYIHKGKARNFMGPIINNLDIERFSKALNTRKDGMPRYFLTKKEIEMLFFYVNINLKKVEEVDEN
ncbi:MAG: cytochrome c [Campylobacterota bacterium]|nr:cytochrome c [Campylobacterota bacterium]